MHKIVAFLSVSPKRIKFMLIYSNLTCHVPYPQSYSGIIIKFYAAYSNNYYNTTKSEELA